MKDANFIAMLSQVYDVKGPTNIPPDVNEELAA
jgi:hypothetical protein